MNAAHEAVFVLPVGGIKEDAKQMTFVMRHDRNPKYQVGRFAVDISMSAPPTTGNKDTDHQIAGVKRRMRNYKTFSAGGGIKPGHMHGTTDEPGFGQEEGRIHVHDLHATILHQLGIDHKQLTYRFQGRDFRLTDVHGEVIHDILV